MNERNRYIEGLRAIGCFMVVSYHLTFRYIGIFQEEYIAPSYLRPMSEFGRLGALLFLLISFFLIINSKIKSKGFCRTYTKRYYNLFFPYVISICICYAAEQFINLGSRNVSLRTFLCNLTMLPDLFDRRHVDGAHWYITTLLIITFWVLLIERYAKHRQLCYLVLLATKLITVDHFLVITFFQRNYMCVAVCAVMLRYIIDSDGIKDRSNLMNIAVSLLAHAVVWRSHGLLYLTVLIGYEVLIVLCYYKKMIFLDNAVFVYVASISYYIYLIHQNISYMVLNVISEITGDYHIWYALGCIPVVCILTIFIKKASDVIYGALNPYVKSML